MSSGFRAGAVAAIVILVWGMTFANTLALLGDFSALEILVVRFALAWTALWGWEVWGRCGDRNVAAPIGGGDARRRWAFRDEGLFAAMGFCGVFFYQFMENCAIYYTNASNVAIFVSFGPIVTAALARMFTKDRSLNAALLVGSLIAIVGVALVSMNDVINLHLRPLGDLMASGRGGSVRPSRSPAHAASAKPCRERDYAASTRRLKDEGNRRGCQSVNGDAAAIPDRDAVWRLQLGLGRGAGPAGDDAVLLLRTGEGLGRIHGSGNG